MRQKRAITVEGGSTNINISPLIDMVFILLIFFIVTTVFVEEEGVEVNKPEPASVMNLDVDTIVFTVTPAGQILHDGQNIGLEGVRATVRRLSRLERLPVIIRAQDKSTAGMVVRIMDEARLAGAEAISITEDQI